MRMAETETTFTSRSSTMTGRLSGLCSSRSSAIRLRRRPNKPACLLMGHFELRPVFRGIEQVVALPALTGSDRIHEQHRDGHRPDAAGYGGNIGRFFRHTFEIHITYELAVTCPVNSNIDYDSAGPDHLRKNKVRLARGHDQNIGEDRELREVFGLRVADANGRFMVHQHQRH